MCRWLTNVFAIGGMSVIAACAAPPQKAIDDTAKAIDEAKAAEAATYAPASLVETQELYNSALAEVEAQNARFAPLRSYAEAEAMLTKANEQAQKTRTEAEASREETRRQAATVIEEAQAEIRASEQALKDAPQGKGTRAELEAMQAELVALTATLSEAQNAFDEGDYHGAISKASTVKTEARAIGNDIAKARGKRNA